MDGKTLNMDRTSSLDDYYRMLSDTVKLSDEHEERDAYDAPHQPTEIKVSYPEYTNIMTKKELLQKSKTHGEDRWSTFPVHSSIFYGVPPKVILKLLSSNPDSLKTKDDRGQLPLHLAFRRGDEDLIIEFLKTYPESFYVKDNQGKIPFQCTALNHKFSETLSELLESYDHLNCIHKSTSYNDCKAIAINDNNSERENASNTEAREEEGRTMEKRLELLNDELSSQEDKRRETQVLEGTIENLNNKLHKQDADYSVALKKIQDLEEQNSELRKRNETPVLEGTIENLNNKLHKQDADYSVALKKIQDLEEQNSELPGLKRTVTELKEQIVILERRNNTLGTLALDKLAASEERNNFLVDIVALLKKEKEESHTSHAEEVKGYKEKLKDLDTSLEIISTLKEENKVIPVLEKQIQYITEEAHGKSMQNTKLKEKVKNLEEQSFVFKEKAKNLEDEIQVLQEVKKNMDEALLEKSEKIDVKNKENSEMKEKMKNLEEMVNRLPSEEETAALRGKIEKMVPKLFEHIQELENKIVSKNEDCKKSSERIHQLEDEKNYHIKAMEDLKKTLAGSEQRLSKSLVKNAALQEENNKLIPHTITKMNDVIQQNVIKNKKEEEAKKMEESYEKATELVRVEKENTKIPELKQTIDEMKLQLTISSNKCSALEGLMEENEQVKSGIEKAMQIIDILEKENKVITKVDDNNITEENRVLGQSIELLREKMNKRLKDLLAVLCQNMDAKETIISGE